MYPMWRQVVVEVVLVQSPSFQWRARKRWGRITPFARPYLVSCAPGVGVGVVAVAV
jgi:hypothetical protein